MAKVAWIGLGNMGVPMSINLVGAGHEVTVWNRTDSKCEEPVKAGAKKAASIHEAVKDAEFVFTMISDSAVLERVILGTDGAAESLKSGAIVIDMSTVSLDSSRKCNEAIEKKGCQFLRAPVSGSTVLAKSGALTILCSGPKAAFEKTKPLFEKLSKTQFHIGEGDQARAMKLALNMMIATSLQMFAESVVLCEKSGIELGTALDVIAGSVLASPLIAYKIPPIRERKFNPAFSTRLMAKDLDLALAVAKELGVFAPVTGITKQMLESSIANGNSENDFAALLPMVEKMSGMDCDCKK